MRHSSTNLTVFAQNSSPGCPFNDVITAHSLALASGSFKVKKLLCSAVDAQ